MLDVTAARLPKVRDLPHAPLVGREPTGGERRQCQFCWEVWTHQPVRGRHRPRVCPTCAKALAREWQRTRTMRYKRRHPEAVRVQQTNAQRRYRAKRRGSEGVRS